MIDKLFQLARRVRRAASRTRWTARLLRHPVAKDSDKPGLVILQIDGLSRTEFDRAIAKGRMPKLAKLIRTGHYAPMSFYSGLPSTTPAVQAEVIYGVRCAVPAFQFLDRERGKVVRMFDDDVAERVGARLAAEHEPLLAGGNSYSNIYSGGAADSRFCADTLDDEPQRLWGNPLQTFTMALLYSWTIVRVLTLVVLEFVIAVGDMIRGVAGREDLRTEVKYLPSRVAVAIVMREYLRVMVKLAIEEGSPVIHANFLGYDEQAHRRGPDSWFAHWVLKGIDGVIGDISRMARRSPHREYEVVVFSDHGQERTAIYDRLHDRSIQDAVKEAFAEGPLAGRKVRAGFEGKTRGAELNQRARRLLRVRRSRKPPPVTADDSEQDVIITALGPLGHIYTPTPLGDEDKEFYARRLVQRDSVPLTIYLDAEGVAWARNDRGLWRLPAQGDQVLGPDHPFLNEAVEDLIALCNHADAGDIVISGWDPAQEPVTFVGENGAHGSVGDDEMRGFALVPDGVPMRRRASSRGEAYIRGEDLYRGGRAFLGGAAVRGPDAAPDGHAASERGGFRLMTYNIHSCIGLDGRVRPDRIVQVIRASGADVIALQEVDAHRPRSRRHVQAEYLAEQLGMSHHYFAVLDEGGEQYGLAVISRFPLTHLRSAHLTPAEPRRRREARGAMWVEVETPWGPVQVINTHFGLTRDERLRQAQTLVGSEWIGGLGAETPVVLCGDFNAGASSRECRILGGALVDAHCLAGGTKRRGTFPSPLAVRTLDHVFVSRHFSVAQASQSRSPTAVIASDHLPVCVVLEMQHPKKPDASACRLIQSAGER